MKLFFKNILLFIFPLVIIVIMMDLYLENMNSLYKEKANGLLEHANEIEILILGNSHATYGVDASGFSAFAFNIANVGQSIYFDKELTLQNLKKLKNLKYVLISLDYHSLYFSSQRGERNIWSYYGNGIKHPSEVYNKADISPFLFGYYPRVSFSFLKKDLLTKWDFRNHPYHLDFDTEEGVDKTDTLVKGFISFSGTESNVFNNNYYINRINGHDNLINNSTEEEIVLNELDELITKLHSKWITPIFFSTPTFKDYNILLDPDIITYNNLITEKLCKKYNIEFWDYAIDHDFIKKEFFNSDHLNKKGAERFSKMLDLRLKLYKIQQKNKKREEVEKF
tara:strand:+ start:410 stop:1423 length:1014 start_codon:yes stop_codon:yes gene_type:complete